MAQDSTESKSLRDIVLQLISSSISAGSVGLGGDDEDDEDASGRERRRSAREFVATLASWAGKGKDEIVQLICREIGQATASVMKEPLAQFLNQLAYEKTMKITVEFVPANAEQPKSGKSSRPKKPTRTANAGRSRS